jgi:hypothetical protein
MTIKHLESHDIEGNIKSDSVGFNLIVRLGFWTAAFRALTGIVYFLNMIVLLVTGKFTNPPPDSTQVFAGIATFIGAPLLIILMACVQSFMSDRKKILGQIGLIFTALFAVVVSINRFVQFSIVRPGIAGGETEGLIRFLPYDTHSIMWALEMLGWGFFLGLATLFLAPVFTRGRLERTIRWLFITYGILGIISAVGCMTYPPMAAVGFLAWGFILPLAMIFLTIWFRRKEKEAM